MKKNIRKTIALFCAVFVLIGMFSIPTAAASTRKCYLIKNQNTTVYSNSGLSKTYGTIWGSDEITVLTVTSKYCRVSYPVSGGSKIGYIPTSAILTSTTGNTYASKAQITTYRRPGGYSYGYISKGDQVMILGSYGSYTQVKYPVSGGYKYAFVTTSNANTYLKNKSTDSDHSNTTKKINLSYGLYKSNAARITCGFDGYVTQRGCHEGIDIKYAIGKPVYSLTDGVVVRVVYGSNGSNGLSTIAIYNSATNKTVIYLHAAPSKLRVGQSIKKGEQIAKEAWRGVKNSSGAHTHVEVRNGRQGYACKSVGDYKLENQNPTSFWNSQGYNIR